MPAPIELFNPIDMNNSRSVGLRQKATRFEQFLQLDLRNPVADIATMLDAGGREVTESVGIGGAWREAGFDHEVRVRQIDIGDCIKDLEPPCSKNASLKLLIERPIGDCRREIIDRLQ